MRNPNSVVLILLAALCAGVGAAAPQARESAPPAPAASAPRGPDLLGIYPGMPAAEARRRLQARSDAIRVEDIIHNSPEYGFSLNMIGGSQNETIKVHTTLPPSPPVVWMIERTVSYAAMYGRLDNLVAKSTLLTTLREKYGQETAPREFGPKRTDYWWLFDQNGQRVASADTRMLDNCRGAFRYAQMSPNYVPPPVTAQFQPCLSSYYALSVNVSQSHGPEVVDHFEAILANLPLGYRAAVAYVNAQNAAAEAAKKRELEKAKRKKPVF